MCGFLQRDSYSVVVFAYLKSQCANYFKNPKDIVWGNQEKKDVKRTHSLFVDGLKVYQENHKTWKDINEMIVQASNDTAACYGVAKCAKAVFDRRKMVKVRGLQVLNERMKTIDPNENEIYKFLGVEQADGIKKKEVYKRVKEEINRRLNIIARTELNDKNQVKAINTKVIPVAAFAMNICKFTQSEHTDLDQVIKRTTCWDNRQVMNDCT